MRLGAKKWAGFVSLGLMLAACRASDDYDVPAPGDEEGVAIPLAFRQVAPSLSLTGEIADILLRIDGCRSGFAKSFPIGFAGGTTALAEGDHGCRAQVVNFQSGSETFTRLDPAFVTAVGGTTRFTSPSGRVVSVVVTAQLSDAIRTESENIGFLFVESQSGGRLILDNLGFETAVATVVGATMVDEAGPKAVFQVTREGSLDSALTVTYQMGGTATAGEDYRAPLGNVQFAAGQASTTVEISLTDDTLYEPTETLSLQLLASSTLIPYGGPATVSLLDNEGATGTASLVLRLEPTSLLRSGSLITQWSDTSGSGNSALPPVSTASPTYLTPGIGTLAAASFDGSTDGLTVGGSTGINSGGPYEEKTVVVVFRTGSDTSRSQVLYEQGEGNRGLNLYLSGGSLYFNGWNLINDDGGATTPWGPLAVSTPVNANTAYVARLVFSFSERTITGYLNGVRVGQIAGAGRLFAHTTATSLGYTDNRTRLHSGRVNGGQYFGGRIGEVRHHNGKLTESDGQAIDQSLLVKFGLTVPLMVSASANAATVDEGAEVQITIARSAASAQALTVPLAISGTAVNGNDYTGMPASVTIPANATFATFTVVTTDDVESEGNETLTVGPAASASYQTGAAVTVTIRDDDTFTPSAGIVRWFSGTWGVTLEGGRVSRWTDFLGQVDAATQALASARPAWLADTQALEFDGVDDGLAVASSPNIDSGGPYQERTIAMVFTTGANVSRRQVLWQEGDENRGLVVYVEAAQLRLQGWNLSAHGGYTPWGPLAVSVPADAMTSYRAVFSLDAANRALVAVVNGASVSTGGAGPLYAHARTSGIGGSQGNIRLLNGKKDGAPNPFGGRIGELMIYNALVQGSDFDALDEYLLSRMAP